MNLKKLRIAIPFVALSATLLGGCGESLASFKNVSEIKSEYFLNETVQVPKRMIDCDGVMVESKCTVKTPSGLVNEIDDSFVISEFGIYELTYSANYNGKNYVKKDAVTGVRRAVDLFKLGEGNLDDAKITQEAYLYDSLYYGVKTTISAGGCLYFNQPIDFSKQTIDSAFLSMLIEPHCSDGADCSSIEFLFTDVDDPTNQMTILYASGDTYGYARSGGKGQELKGWQNNHAAATSTLHINKFGNPMFCSFDRKRCESQDNNYPLSFFYVPESNQLYGSRTRCFPWGETPSIIIDYDDPLSWGENIWKGFPSGRANLKITPKQTSSSNVTLLFTSLGGFSFVQDKFVDVEKPTLSFGKTVIGNVGPQAKVGESYKIFECKAFDTFDGNLDYNVHVNYVNPTNEARSDVEIINNSFVPNIPGVYEITYSATDRSGNSESKTINVVATNNISPLEVILDDNDKQLDIFQDVNILPASAAKAVGGSGDVSIFRTIYGPKGRIIDTDKNYISLDDVGDYKVIYEAIDYLGHYGSKIITITSNNIPKPKIMGTFSFPEALLKGFAYDIPKLYSKECTDEGVITKEAVVLINGEEWKEPSFVASGEKMRIQYVAKGVSGKEDRITKEFVVRDGKEGSRQDEYFYCENSEVVLERNYITYKTSSSDNKTTFINKINSRSFTIVMNYNFNTFNASGIRVTLEDEMRIHSFTMNIAVGKTDCKLSYPGSSTTPTVATQYDFGINKMRLSYNSANGTVTDIDSNVLCYINRDDSGKAFGGFDGYVYASVSIIEPDEAKGSILMLEKLSNQTLGYRASDISRACDTISPEIYLDYEFDRKQIIGSTFTVPKALSCDVLNPIETFTVQMYSRTETGAIKDMIINNEDASVEHTVKLDTYDNFLIKYTSVDAAGNDVIATRLLYVIENQAPILEADFSNINDCYYVGDEISLPTYRVSDNSGHYNVDIYVYDSHSRVYLLQSDRDGVITSILNTDLALYDSSFIASKTSWKAPVTGEYKYKIVATDDCYNYSSSEFIFHVTDRK